MMWMVQGQDSGKFLTVAPTHHRLNEVAWKYDKDYAVLFRTKEQAKSVADFYGAIVVRDE